MCLTILVLSTWTTTVVVQTFFATYGINHTHTNYQINGFHNSNCLKLKRIYGTSFTHLFIFSIHWRKDIFRERLKIFLYGFAIQDINTVSQFHHQGILVFRTVTIIFISVEGSSMLCIAISCAECTTLAIVMSSAFYVIGFSCF